VLADWLVSLCTHPATLAENTRVALAEEAAQLFGEKPDVRIDSAGRGTSLTSAVLARLGIGGRL
jgi:hypothetical protein